MTILAVMLAIVEISLMAFWLSVPCFGFVEFCARGATCALAIFLSASLTYHSLVARQADPRGVSRAALLVSAGTILLSYFMAVGCITGWFFQMRFALSRAAFEAETARILEHPSAMKWPKRVGLFDVLRPEVIELQSGERLVSFVLSDDDMIGSFRIMRNANHPDEFQLAECWSYYRVDP